MPLASTRGLRPTSRASRLLVLVCLLLSTMACQGGTPDPSAAAKPGCPDAETLEQLHTLIYLIEHGGDKEAVAARADGLRRVRGLDRHWSTFVARCLDLARLYAVDDPNTRLQEEELRADLHFSPCLTPSLHTAMHSRLER